jgi:XTP/dITP diphosphohydrolase
MSRVLLATRNSGKVAEMQRILAEQVSGIEVVGLDAVAAYDEPAETEPTFTGNARIKALAAVRATGLPSLADDSGICVDALNGMPGVLSARWAGLTQGDRSVKDRANNELLLAQLADVPDERRTAQFRCAVVLAVPTGDGVLEHAVEEQMPGRVIRELRGRGGFGYDVLFCADGYDRTTAELPPQEKDAISHRGKALRAIAPVVASMLGAAAGDDVRITAT